MDNAIRTSSAGTRDAAGLMIGLFLGGLAGLGIMMLFAPRSGKETRIRMHDRAANTIDDLVALSHYDNRKFTAGSYERTKSG